MRFPSKHLLAGAVAAVTATGAVNAQNAILQSAGALAFDTANTLFVGDGKAGLVHAFDLSNLVADQASYQLGRAQNLEGGTILNKL